MVLAISAIVIGGAVGLMIFSSDERALRNTSGEIELLAKRARTISILHQTPYALEFREGVVRLLPLAQAGMDLKDSRNNYEESDSEMNAADESRQIDIEGGIELSIRHWNSQDWLKVIKKSVQVWRFDPDGLCEPISIRLAMDNSWSEDTYHPLTATISESQLEAR